MSMKALRFVVSLSTCILLFTSFVLAQGNTSLGLRIQKTPNLYYENGISYDYSSPDLLSNRLHLGVSYASSRLGSAIGSNALKQDNLLLSVLIQFRNEKKVMPLIGLNLGYFMVDTEEEMFDVLPNTSLLLSIELGLGFRIMDSVFIRTSAGYNLFTGDGVDGPGTLYPIFLNFTTFYELKGGRK